MRRVVAFTQHPAALLFLLALSLCGLAVALWAHIVALRGMDPGSLIHDFWLCQLLLSVLIVPIPVELVRKKSAEIVFRSPPWMRYMVYLLLAYYGANFYFFLYWSSDHLDAAVTWRMFSSGWLLLFGQTASYYAVRYLETRCRLKR
jgi:hypothetical protein